MCLILFLRLSVYLFIYLFILPFQHAELGKRLGKSVTDVLLHLDRVTGDDQVRAARRKQVGAHKSTLITANQPLA